MTFVQFQLPRPLAYSFTTFAVQIPKRSELTQPIILTSVYAETLMPGPAQAGARPSWEQGPFPVPPGEPSTGRSCLIGRHGCPDSRYCGQGSVPWTTG